MLNLAIDRASTAGVERCWDRKGQVAAAFKPPNGDVRIYERLRAGGNAIKWDVCLVKGHFLRFHTRNAASVAIECWARDNIVSAWITKNDGQDWQRWPL